MSEKINKKQSNTVVGYLLVAGGILSTASMFIIKKPWSAISKIQLTISLLAIVVGLWYVLKKK